MTLDRFLSLRLSRWATPSILRMNLRFLFLFPFEDPPAQSPHPGKVTSSSLSSSSSIIRFFSSWNSLITSSPINASLINSFCLNIAGTESVSISSPSSGSCSSLWTSEIARVLLISMRDSVSLWLFCLRLAILAAALASLDEFSSIIVVILVDFCRGSLLEVDVDEASQGLDSST